MGGRMPPMLENINQKMMVRKILLLAFLLGILASCGRKTADTIVDNETGIHITVEKDIPEDSRLDLSSFLDSVRFIKLETTPECLIASISDVFFVEDLVIVTAKPSSCIFIFGRDGKYRYKIDKRGRGPGEYNEIGQSLYDADSRTIIIYDGEARKMLFYSLSGEFIREITNFSERTVVRDVINLPDGRFLCYTSDYFTNDPRVDPRFAGLWITDSEGRYLKTLLTYDTPYPTTSRYYDSYMCRDGDQNIILSDRISNDLYCFNASQDDKLSKYITYDIKGPQIYKYKGIRDFTPDMKYVSATDVQVKGNYIYSTWLTADGFFAFSVCNVEKEDFRIASNKNLSDPAMPAVVGWPLDCNLPDVIVQAVEPNIIEDYVFGNSLPEISADLLRNLTVGMTKDQISGMNPILQLWYVKK